MFTGDRDIYQVTIEVFDYMDFINLELFFSQLEHPHLTTEGDWNAAGEQQCQVTFLSTRKPYRLEKGWEPREGEMVAVDFRPMVKELDTALYQTCVLISCRKADEDVEGAIADFETSLSMISTDAELYDW